MILRELFEDFRGKISLLEGDMTHPEVTIFKTFSGFARGGCIHALHDKYSCVIEGCVEYCIGDKKIRLETGESVVIPQNTPHYYISITDSIVLEWGATPEEKQEKHVEYRKVVDKINKEQMVHAGE